MHYVIIRKFKTMIFKDTHHFLQRKLSRYIQLVFEFKQIYDHKNKKTSLAIYDLNLNPITFDFCPFLFMAWKFFEKRGQRNFDLIIILKDENSLDQEKNQRISDILLPIINMCDRVRSFQIIKSNLITENEYKNSYIYPQNYTHIFKRRWNYNNYLNSNYFVNRDSILEPPDTSIKIIKEWIREKNINANEYVTITIRNSRTHDILRNSNLLLLKEFSEWIMNQHINVVIIPDTENQDIGQIKSTAVCDIASYNLYHRVALYKLSKLNIFNNNGPSVIPQIGGMRFMITGMNNEESEFGKAKIIERVGLKINEQPFDDGSQGYFVWGKEDIESLKKYFLKLMKNL